MRRDSINDNGSDKRGDGSIYTANMAYQTREVMDQYTLPTWHIRQER